MKVKVEVKATKVCKNCSIHKASFVIRDIENKGAEK